MSRGLMCTVKGSSMEAMFNGKHTLTKRDKVVFLDRDPDVFVMVVSYLRNGLIYPPIEDFVLK